VVELAEEIGAELIFTVNFTNGTPEDAADWIRYVNKNELKVKYWEIGNEQYIDSSNPVSRAVTVSPREYASRAQEFAIAMRAADPRLKIGVIGGLNEGPYKQMDYDNWNETVYSQLRGYFDFISIHNAYGPVLTGDQKGKELEDVYKAMLGRPQAIARNLARMETQLAEYFPNPTSRPFIAVTEWGPIFQFFHEGEYVDHPKTLGSALFAASTLKTLVESPSTNLAAFWMLNDYSVLGWLSSANNKFPPDPEWIPTARAYAFEMFSSKFGRSLVKSDVVGPSFDSQQVGWSAAETDIPNLEIVSSLDEAGDTLYIIGINNHFEAAIDAEITLTGFAPQVTGTRWILGGTSIDAHTGSEVIAVPGLKWGDQETLQGDSRFESGSPNEVTLREYPLDSAARTFTVSFPKHSVTSIVLKRK